MAENNFKSLAEYYNIPPINLRSTGGGTIGNQRDQYNIDYDITPEKQAVYNTYRNNFQAGAPALNRDTGISIPTQNQLNMSMQQKLQSVQNNRQGIIDSSNFNKIQQEQQAFQNSPEQIAERQRIENSLDTIKRKTNFFGF